MANIVPRIMKRKPEFRKAQTFFGGNATGASTSGDGVASDVDPISVSKTVFTLTNGVVTMADAAGVVGYGGRKFGELPQGNISILGATANLAVTKTSAGINADWDGDFAVGTVTAAADATLTGTEANIIASTATPQAVAGATTAKGRSTAAVVLDGTTTPVSLFLNFLVDDADQDMTTTPCNLILNGTVTVSWINLGDY